LATKLCVKGHYFCWEITNTFFFLLSTEVACLIFLLFFRFDGVYFKVEIFSFVKMLGNMTREEGSTFCFFIDFFFFLEANFDFGFSFDFVFFFYAACIKCSLMCSCSLFFLCLIFVVEICFVFFLVYF